MRDYEQVKQEALDFIETLPPARKAEIVDGEQIWFFENGQACCALGYAVFHGYQPSHNDWASTTDNTDLRFPFPERANELIGITQDVADYIMVANDTDTRNELRSALLRKAGLA